ncbi:hypothetical protein HOG48_05000 [Candidatus Peregrinibacteria bacterium]|jgi:hypothetical protein|nr:hypothetical protein [Candidatus Peregrinibacteria bacterium]
MANQSEIQQCELDCASWNDAQWKEEQRKLSKHPYLASHNNELFQGIGHALGRVAKLRGYISTNPYEPDTPNQIIDPRLIVRAPSFANWSDQYHQAHSEEARERGELSVIEIGRKIASRSTGSKNSNQLLQSLDDVFREEDRVKLRQINGPRGPIYFVNDGSHRVAAAKLTGLEKIKAGVGTYTPPEGEEDILWFEARHLMSPEAWQELNRVYDLIYPPTADITASEATIEKTVLGQREDLLMLQQEYEAADEELRKKSTAQHLERKTRFDRAEKIYETLKGDPTFETIRNQAAIEHITSNILPNDYFYNEYNGEISSDGYLMKKDGTESNCRAIGYDVGPFSYQTVLANAVDKYESQFPERIAEILGSENLSPNQKLTRLFNEFGMPLNNDLQNMLNEDEDIFTTRRGAGFNQAIHYLARIINSGKGEIFNYDYIESLYEAFDDGKTPMPPLKTLIPIDKIIAKLPELEEEAQLVAQMIVDLVIGYTPTETDINLPVWNEKPDAGWCSTAELYFLEYANHIHKITRPMATFNTITDSEGTPIMVEKIGAGNQSAITLKETVLNGVRIPAGSLVYIERDKKLSGEFPITECHGVHFLRCTTLAISPENRERAFGKQIDFQRNNAMPAYDTTTIEGLTANTDLFSTW